MFAALRWGLITLGFAVVVPMLWNACHDYDCMHYIRLIRDRAIMSSSVPSGPIYRHIRLANKQDVDRLYPLIPLYIQNPNLLSSLKDFTFSTPHLRIYERFDIPSVEDNARIPHQNVVENYITSLNLPAETAQQLNNAFRRHSHLLNPKSTTSKHYQKNGHGKEVEWSDFAHFAAPVLLSLAKNVETIRCEELSWSSPVRAFLEESNYNQLSGGSLRNLRNIHLGPSQSDIYNDPRFYSPFDLLGMLSLFHRLPNLESVTFDAVTEDPEGRELVPAHISNLKSINITHSSLGSLRLASLIRLPKQGNLEEFHYTHGGRAENLDGSSLVFPRTIGKALDTQRASLRVLEIDNDEEIFFMPGYGHDEAHHDADHYASVLEFQRQDAFFARDEQDSGVPVFPWDLPDTKTYGHTIGSLADFERLESLRVGVKLLLGPKDAGPPPFTLVDTLPRSLREFTLLGYRRGENPEVDVMVDEFVRLRAEKFPLLTDVAGIDKRIRSGHSRYHPDRDEDKMWQPVEWNEDWVEA